MIEHWDAWCNLIGSLLGLLGGFFLAYDIIGGKKGALSGMTRGVIYIVLYFIGYTTGLGLRFGLIASSGLGTTLAMAFYFESRWSRTRKKARPKYFPHFLGMGRSFFLSLGLAAVTDWKVGLIVFPINAIALWSLDYVHIAPAIARNVSTRLVFQKKQVFGSIFRGGAAGLGCWLAETLAGDGTFCYTVLPWKFALTIGATSIFVGAFTPWVECWVERMSQRWLAAVGIFLLIMGFILQALPNWIVLLS